jgi:hypothetical protein
MPAILPSANEPFYPAVSTVFESLNTWESGLKVVFTTLNTELYAIQDGELVFIPASNNVDIVIPGTNGTYTVNRDFYAPGAGIVVLRSLALVNDTSVSRLIIYHNVQASSFLAAIQNLFNQADAQGERLIHNKLMRKLWKDHHNTYHIPNTQAYPTDVEYNNFYMAQCMLGKLAVPVRAAAVIGQAGVRTSNPQQSFLAMESGVRVNQTWEPETFFSKLQDAGFAYPNFARHPIFEQAVLEEITWEAHIKFEVWNKNHGSSYVPISCAVINLKDHSALNGVRDRVVASVESDSFTGVAKFELPNIVAYMNTLEEGFPRFYFEIECPQDPDYKGTGLQLPVTWQTKSAISDYYWEATDGTKGFLNTGLTPRRMGTSQKPLVFRVGLEYHIAFKIDNSLDDFKSHKETFLLDGIAAYLCRSNTPTTYPMGPNVDYVYKGYSRSGNTSKGSAHTNIDSGILRYIDNRKLNFSGIVFEEDGQAVEPGYNYFFELEFNVQDNNVSMLKTTVDTAYFPEFWLSSWHFAGQLLFKNWCKTTLGDYSDNAKAKGTVIKKREIWFNFYLLHTIREVNQFFKYFTGNQWSGLETNVFIHFVRGLGAFATPDYGNGGTSTIDFCQDTYCWDRSTIAHEFTHLVHARKYQNSSFYWSKATAWLGGNSHYTNDITNSYFAFTEGLAEFIQFLFAGTFEDDANKGLTNRSLHGGTAVVETLTPRLDDAYSHGIGSQVEGAFAMALADVFWLIVAKGIAPAGTKKINQDIMGNLQSSNSWMKDSNQNKLSDRFKTTFWDAFEEMDQDGVARGVPEVVQLMLQKVKPEYKHTLLACMWRFNILLPKMDTFSHLNDAEIYTDTEAISATFNQQTSLITITGKNFAEIMSSRYNQGNDTVEMWICTGSILCKDIKVRSHDQITCKLERMPSSRPVVLSLDMGYKIRGVHFEVYKARPITITV